MSNERIDLTQFEGKGIVPLMVLPNTYTIAQDNNRIYEDYNYPDDDENRYGWIVGNIDSHYECDDPEYGVVQSERQEVMAKLFAMAPDLLAELKRCYEMIDEAQEYVRHLTATPDILTMRLGKDPTTDNLRNSLEGLLVLLGADEHSGYGSHSSEH